MNFPVIRGTSYVLVHAPSTMVHHGTTQVLERGKEGGSEYLKKMPQYVRKFTEAAAYPPNQVYIGNMTPDALAVALRPWYANGVPGASRFGRYGEIMPEGEFYGLMKLVDSFQLVVLTAEFAAAVKEKLLRHKLFAGDDLSALGTGAEPAEVKKLIAEQHAEPLYDGDILAGCVKRAHDKDETLAAHVMLENLITKASGMLALRHLFAATSLKPENVDYILECSEEACGDMNQRGGGNFAKAIGEVAGCVNATGADVRGFCAAPAHAIVAAAALVQAGIYRNVVVVAGGATAKLGMNGRDHVAKGVPMLEDMLGGFAVHIGENDGINPVIRTDRVGRHVIGSGASPQAVMQAIVADPLEKADLKLTDVDRYAAELQNPEITEPAGAGDVPKANFKMIAALAVRKNEIGRTDIDRFVLERGVPGFAPTQGHIPSGVPFIGPARELILDGKIRRAMIIGKGSLFLGRMTNQFDGISFLMETNPGKKSALTLDEGAVRTIVAEAMRDVAENILARAKAGGA